MGARSELKGQRQSTCVGRQQAAMQVAPGAALCRSTACGRSKGRFRLDRYAPVLAPSRIGSIPSEESRGVTRPDGDLDGRPRTQAAEGSPEKAGASAEAGAQLGREHRSCKIRPGDKARPPTPALMIRNGRVSCASTVAEAIERSAGGLRHQRTSAVYQQADLHHGPALRAHTAPCIGCRCTTPGCPRRTSNRDPDRRS